MTHEVAKTGLGPTLLVAIEQNYPENKRIISDHLASSMLPFGMRIFIWFMQFSVIRDWMVKTIEKKSSGLWAGLLCRKRYIDEKLFKKNPDKLIKLKEKQMKEAVKALDFETAAILRDEIKVLKDRFTREDKREDQKDGEEVVSE